MSSYIDDLRVPSSPTPCSLRKTTMHVTFCDPLVDSAQQHSSATLPQGLSGKMKTASLEASFGQNMHIKGTECKHPSTTPSKHLPQPALIHNLSPKAIIPLKSALKVQLTKATAPCSTSAVQDIMALKWAFLDSSDTFGNMSGTYTIRTDPSVLPIQHAPCKVPITYREQIECTLNGMVTKGIIAPVSRPTERVSSLTYPCKPDGTLCICLDPKDLNKAIVQDHYKAPTLDDICHCLSGATCFSKLGANDGFRSIHLDEKSSYLTTFNTHCGRYKFPA